MMVLCHTEEELVATKEPAICVIGATSCETVDSLSNEPIKVYIRICRQNDACEMREMYLFNEATSDPADKDGAAKDLERFKNERSRLVFGTDEAQEIGYYNGVVVLARKETKR